VGLKCGGSDGFSGISANPAIGHTADLLAALGGRTILSEFPELCGVEQELINRGRSKQVGNRFIDTGAVVAGQKTIEQMSETILDLVIQVANGEIRTKAEQKAEEDFIPWKRGVSL